MDLREDALSVLGWWQLAGADVAVDDAPRDWLAPAKPVQTIVAAPEMHSEHPADLSAFRRWLADDTAFGEGPRLLPEGDPASGLMLLADVPEVEDMIAGSLLAGKLGLLFDRMLAAIGRDRASIYLATLTPIRPPAGRIRDLAPVAEAACRHAALAAPRCLLLLGDTASRAVLGTSAVEARGRIHEINHGGAKIAAIATFHPRELLRTPARKADAWRDLRLLLGELGQ